MGLQDIQGDIERLRLEGKLTLGGTSFNGGNPVTGPSMSLTVPAGEGWQIQWIRAVASPGATAGNRNYRLRIGSSGPNFAAGVNVAASTPTTFFWIAGIDSDLQVSGGEMRVAVPPIILRPGTVVTVENTGFQGAADTLAGSVEYIKLGVA